MMSSHACGGRAVIRAVSGVRAGPSASAGSLEARGTLAGRSHLIMILQRRSMEAAYSTFSQRSSDHE